MTVAVRTWTRRRWALVVLAAALAGLATFVLVWFQPQKLWIDERVSEPAPVAAVAPQPTTAATTAAPAAPLPPVASTTVAPPEPVDLARGALVSRDHHTAGIARVLDLGDGRRVLRLEGLDTSNGPDLYVYLTANPADGPEGAFDDDYANLGRLKGNQGDQNYDVPADVDLTRHATVVIWCDRFDSAFGAADLAG